MSEKYFEVLESAGFGSNVHEVAAEGDCRVLRIDGDMGDGFMTMYRVFDGVYLMYNDLHLRQCESEYRNAETVLCFDHCREGRIEHENSLGDHYYMEAGDLRIDRRIHHEGRVELPLSHYHGITIGFICDESQSSLEKELSFLSVDLEKLAKKFCPDNREMIIRSNELLGDVFDKLYHPPKNRRLDYFRIKIAELLLLLDSADFSGQKKSKQYYPVSQTEKIKQLHGLMTGSLDKSYTVDELSAISGMQPAALRKVFKAVYGAPVYQYIKGYKMKAAAAMLISERKVNISEIAQRLGYDNASKFSAAFKDVMGLTPQNYRTRQEEE